MATGYDAGMLPAYGEIRDVFLRSERGIGKPLEECTRKEVGGYGEDVAAGFLKQCGAQILERNWRCKFGEADIIALVDDLILMIEVKTRTNAPEEGWVPESAVDYRKRGRYEKMALVYLSNQTRVDSVRFDVVALNLYNEHDMCLRYIAGAFGWDC